MPNPVEKITGTGTIEVHVNTNTGSVAVNPSSVILAAAGAKVKYALSFEPGSPSEAGVRAYVCLHKHNYIVPTDPTKNDGYQDAVFALRDTASPPNDLEPTFIAQSQGEARLLVVVLFPEGIAYTAQPAESVVIVDW